MAWRGAVHEVMDNVQRLIKLETDAIAELERKIALHRARLEAFREVAGATNSPIVPNNPNTATLVNQVSLASLGGSQNAISFQWAKTILDLVNSDRIKSDYNQIFETAKLNGYTGSKDSCRDRVRDYVKTGIMVGSALGGFKTTQIGIDRAKATITVEEETGLSGSSSK